MCESLVGRIPPEALAFLLRSAEIKTMRSQTRLLIPWLLFVVSAPLIGVGCEGSDSVRFAGPPAPSDGGDASTGTGGSAAGGGGGAGASGNAGTGGAEAGGAGGSSGGAGGAAGAPGTGGAGGASGASGAGGTSGTSGTGGAGGASGTSGTGGAAGASGTGGASGASGTSGTGGAAGAAGAAGASGAGGASGNGGNAGSAGSGTDASADADASPADALSEGDVATDRPSDAGCPNVFGTYQINNADGMCGNLNENAPQEIRGTTQVCALHFISVVDGGVGAINGQATLGPDGTFSGETLFFGTAMRNPCIGTWDANQDELTVVCNSGSANECLVELLRTGP
jgi:hypothetical protein